MKYVLKHFVWQFALLSIVIFAAHSYILWQFFQDETFYFPLWTIYLFNSGLVIVLFSVLYFKVRGGASRAYQIFLILTLIKMVLAVVFLLPLIFGKSPSPVADVINFFIPYFLFLGFEIWALNNFISKL